VIEVDAGRNVDVVLTQGVAIEVPDEPADQSTPNADDATTHRPAVADEKRGDDDN
jgi:hypothetical protein